MRAANAVDPTGHVAQVFNSRLAAAGTSGKQAISDLIFHLKGTNSVYLQRAASVFLEDIQVLEERASKGLSLATSAFDFRIPSRSTTAISSKILDAKTRNDLHRIAELTGTKLELSINARQDIRGGQILAQFQGGKGAKVPTFHLTLPQVLKNNPGVFFQGGSQQSKYIAGGYGIVEGGVLKESFNHTQWIARRAVEDLVPQMLNQKRLDRRQMRDMISQFESSIAKHPEWIPTTLKGSHRGLDEYTRVRSRVLRLFDPSGKMLDPFQSADLMAAGGIALPGGGTLPLFPAFSESQIAKGVFSTVDVRDWMNLVPEAADYGRRPGRFVRANVTPTPDALANLGANPNNARFRWMAANTGVETPMVKALYVSEALASKVPGVTSQGQMLISSNLSEQRRMRRWQQFDVAADQVAELKQFLGDPSKGSWVVNQQAKQGMFLGYSPDGRPVTLPRDMFISSVSGYKDDFEKGRLRVMAYEDVSDMSYSKVFGGFKGMTAEVSDAHLAKLRSALQAEHIGGGYASPVDAIMTMDMLKKERNLHYNQMFSSLWEHTSARMKSGKQLSTLASNFANDPRAVIAQLRKTALDGDKFSHDTMLKQIFGLARGAGLKPQQMGEVFGAVPEVFGSRYTDLMAGLTAAEKSWINSGVAGGVTQLFYEDFGGPGAGKRAKIEPRMFELLSAPHLGQLGPELQADIVRRMSATYPERLFEQNELTTALDSLVNPRMREGSATIDDVLQSIGEKGILPTSATNVRVPGFGDIYIPASNTISQLAQYRTSEGDIISSDLSKVYRETLGAVNQFKNEEITRADLTRQLDTLTSEVARSRVLSITGHESLLRNRLPGSMFLTATEPLARTSDEAIGITRPYAEQMFSDLERVYGADQVSAMRSRFFEGGTVGGFIGRHPYIGQYSTQPAMFRLMEGDQAIASIPERILRARVATGKVSNEELHRLGETLSSPLRLSVMPGMAGDVDGDVVSATLAGPQLEPSLAAYAADQHARDLYESHAIRSQLLKAKTPGDALTLREAMKGAQVKLGVTKGRQLGQVSLALQQSRAAVLANYAKISADEQANALGLLEWLEQTPISGKHLKAGEESQIFGLLDNIREAVHRRDAGRLAQSARSVLETAHPSAKAALEEGLTVQLDDLQDASRSVTRFIPGLNVSKTSENIANSLAAFENMKVGDISAADLRALSMGRALPTVDQAAGLLDENVLKLSPFASLMQPVAKTKFANVAANISTAINRAAAAGKSLIPHARPLLLGSAAAIGLATLLSEPPRALSSGAAIPPQPDLRSGSGGATTNIHPRTPPATNLQGEEPDMTRAANTARITGPSGLQSSGFRFSIRGQSAGGVDYNTMSRQLRDTMGRGATINSTIRDRRRSLNAQNVSDVLAEG